MSDENEYEFGYNLEGEQELRAQTSQILEETWLSHDPEIVKGQLHGIAESHDFCHFSLDQARKDATAALMRLDFEGVKDAQRMLKVMVDLHLAIEYAHLMVLDHLRRLETPAAAPEPVIDVPEESEDWIYQVRVPASHTDAFVSALVHIGGSDLIQDENLVIVKKGSER